MATANQKAIVKQEIKSIRVACPIMMDDGSSLMGHLSGAECEFPHVVHDSVSQHIDIVISWELAYRIVTRSALYVRI